MALTIKHRVSLDLSLTSVQATVPFRKGDVAAHEVIFNLRNGTTNVELPVGTVAIITVLNGANDGAGVADMCVVDHVENLIRYTPTVAALSVAGNVACELVIIGSYGETLGAPRFHFLVDESMTDVTEVEIAEALKDSKSWGVIQQTAANAEDAARSAETASGSASDASGSAQDAYRSETNAEKSEDAAKMWANGYHKNGGPAVAGEPQYQNNAKHYADESKSARVTTYEYLTAAQEAAGEAKQAAAAIKAGAASISVDLDDKNYKLTVALKDANGDTMGDPVTVDFPVESSVTNIEYDSTGKDLIFTLRNNSKTTVPLNGIIAGLATVTQLNAELAQKVGITTDKSRIYGTDSSGKQTLYSISGETGNGTNVIMPQAAVTAALTELARRITEKSEALTTLATKVGTHTTEILALDEKQSEHETRITELEKSGGGGSVEVVQGTGDSTTAVMSQDATTKELNKQAENLNILKNNVIDTAINGVLTINPNLDDLVNGAFGWSGFTSTLYICVTRPVRVYHGEEVTISGNGLRFKCVLAKNDTFENNPVLQELVTEYIEDATFEIPQLGYLIVNIQKPNSAKISPSEASAITITRNIKKSNLINIGLGLMTTDASGNFTVSNASLWKLSAFPVQSGKTYDLTLLTSYSSASRVKWAFTTLPCEEVTKTSLTASKVISHAEPIFTDGLFNKPSCVSVIAPVGAKSLVLNSYVTSSISCGDTHIIRYLDGGDEKVIPQAALNLCKQDIAKNAVSAGGSVEDGIIRLGGAKDYVLGTLIKNKLHPENIILRMTYRIEKDETATKLPSLRATYNNHFVSTVFALDNEEYMEGSWRFPAFGFVNEAMNISVSIPAGTALYIKDIQSEYSNVVFSHETGVRLTAHLGVYDFAPENTMYSFIAAHNLGYPSCVANPKITADGVFVCIHDDDISRTATNADGTEVAKGAVLVSKSNYADLSQYDFGRKYNEVYAGARLPKLDDFLFYCGKVGMKPVFSTHGNFTTEQWQEIKGMLTRYGIVGALTCKSGGIPILETAYSVFGDKIDGYVYDISTVNNINTLIDNLNNSSLAAIKDKVFIEISSSVITQEAVDAVLAAGYKAGVFDVFSTNGETYKKYIKWGVTEFVDDRNCSYGLNW